MLLGVKREYRSRGIETLMLLRSFRWALEPGFANLELSWVLEDNPRCSAISTSSARGSTSDIVSTNSPCGRPVSVAPWMNLPTRVRGTTRCDA